jgi:hypothetical protein
VLVVIGVSPNELFLSEGFSLAFKRAFKKRIKGNTDLEVS